MLNLTTTCVADVCFKPMYNRMTSKYDMKKTLNYLMDFQPWCVVINLKSPVSTNMSAEARNLL